MKTILDKTAQAFGQGMFTVSALDAWMLAMARTDKDLVMSQENGWREVIKYQESTEDQWGGNPSRFIDFFGGWGNYYL